MKLKPVSNGFYTVTEKMIEKLKTKKDVAELLCDVANRNVLEVDDTYAWGLAEQAGLDKSNFYDDRKATIELFGKEAITHHGIVNWKYSEN